jgi:hypothetical protein
VGELLDNIHPVYKEILDSETELISDGGLRRILTFLLSVISLFISLAVMAIAIMMANGLALLAGVGSLAGAAARVIDKLRKCSDDDWIPATGKNAVKKTIPFLGVPFSEDDTLTVVAPGGDNTRFVEENSAIGFFDQIEQRTRYVGIVHDTTQGETMLHVGRIKDIVAGQEAKLARMVNNIPNKLGTKQIIKIDHCSLYKIRNGLTKGDLQVPEATYCYGKDYFQSGTLDGLIISPSP